MKIQPYEDGEIILREPAAADEQTVIEYIKDVCVHGVEFHGSGSLSKMKTFNEWLEYLEQSKNRAYKGYDNSERVPQITMCSFRKQDNKCVGMVNIRPQINRTLDEMAGGNIGYAVTPSEFRKGYGMRQMQLLLQLFKDNGFEAVRVGCNSYNLGSKRIIEKSGGRLISENKGLITWLYYEIKL
jgi:predicted acetyltransferase